MDITKLIEKKKEIKKKNPNFLRQEAHKVKRLIKKWRKPKGIQSKLRESRKGHRKLVKTGYGTPKILRNKVNDSLLVHVSNNDQLDKITNKDLIVLSGKIGNRKRLELLSIIIERKLQVYNIKNVEGYYDELKKSIDSKIKQNKEKKTIKIKKIDGIVKNKQTKESKEKEVKKKLEQSAKDKKESTSKKKELEN